MFIDSHCHLNFPELTAQLPDILSRMAQAQVVKALCISTTMESYPDVLQLAQDHAHLWASVGVHPDNEGVSEPSVQTLVAHAQHPKVVAIGETGLDYYRLGDRSVADMQWQRDRFVCHIEAGRQTDLPLVIHTRNASDDTLALLRDAGQQGQGALSRGVFHCFTETQAVAKAALDLVFYISISGIVTFKNAADLREVVRMVPMDRLLIETDSPYLAPVPHRGKTNTPAWVPHVAQAIADIKGLEIEDVGRITSDNFHRLFDKVTA